jgi:hypothetical protein
MPPPPAADRRPCGRPRRLSVAISVDLFAGYVQGFSIQGGLTIDMVNMRTTACPRSGCGGLMVAMMSASPSFGLNKVSWLFQRRNTHYSVCEDAVARAARCFKG